MLIIRPRSTKIFKMGFIALFPVMGLMFLTLNPIEAQRGATVQTRGADKTWRARLIPLSLHPAPQAFAQSQGRGVVSRGAESVWASPLQKPGFLLAPAPTPTLRTTVTSPPKPTPIVPTQVAEVTPSPTPRPRSTFTPVPTPQLGPTPIPTLTPRPTLTAASIPISPALPPTGGGGIPWAPIGTVAGVVAAAATVLALLRPWRILRQSFLQG